MKITKDLLRTLISEQIQEAFRMEKDFQPGVEVTWNSLEKVEKTTASGRTKVDYERKAMSGTVEELMRSGGKEGGLAVVRDKDGNSHEVEVSELSAVQ
tara:strand:+ start:49 stop:342 length:294 start_codon:yes stop_codon:yes gene_type:complete